MILMTVMMVLMVPLVASYSFNIPKVARPQAFYSSRTQLRETKDSQHEQSFTARPPSKRSSSSKVAMTSAAIDHTAPSRPTFERRMRDLVLGSPKTKKETGTKNLPSNVKVVKTLQEYKKVVGEEQEKIVVTRFYAPWCKACKAMQPVYYKLATKFTNVLFVDVPVTEENASLHQGLGVPSLPYGHIYSPTGGLVEELGITRKTISEFGQKLHAYVTGSCELGDMYTACPYPSAAAKQESS